MSLPKNSFERQYALSIRAIVPQYQIKLTKGKWPPGTCRPREQIIEVSKGVSCQLMAEPFQNVMDDLRQTFRCSFKRRKRLFRSVFACNLSQHQILPQKYAVGPVDQTRYDFSLQYSRCMTKNPHRFDTGFHIVFYISLVP
jgi:hypothetical protein